MPRKCTSLDPAISSSQNKSNTHILENCTHPRDLNYTLCLTQRCCVGIPLQCHRRLGTIEFHPNFSKSILDTPSSSISSGGTAVKRHSESRCHVSLSESAVVIEMAGSKPCASLQINCERHMVPTHKTPRGC